MRSDRCLRSPSLPDPSKWYLGSIVTNEGPSKCSYVASSSNQPSRVFPAGDSFVRHLANYSIRSKSIRPIIDNFSSSDELISIVGEEFNNVATILKSYLSCPDHLQQIRLTLRYTASYPSTFVHILLLPLLPELIPEHLNPSITNDTTYTVFYQFVQHAVQPSNFESTEHSIGLFIEGLQHGAVPKGTAPGSIFSDHVGGRPALTGFATHGYWSPIHIFQGPRFTLRIRFKF